VDTDSTLPDALLRQLIAVGQVDVLVGLPTLNNAATIETVVRAVHVAFTRDLPRLRTVMISSDGGSTDGTPDLIAEARFTEADRVQTSHPLRTLHRVLAPYHGLPGKHTALRTIFAAAELTQAKTIAVIDPAGPSTTPERVTELIAPVARGDVEFLAPRHRRHPRDGVLITQLVRPLVRALYAVALDEPLGSEFSCSGRFSSHCLEQDIWDHESARFAIDLWLRTEAAAERFPIGQIWRPMSPPAGSRATLREVVHQVVLAVIESLRAHESFWRNANAISELRSWGTDPGVLPEITPWDYQALAEQARRDIVEITPLLEDVLDPGLFVRVMDNANGAGPRLDDELWVRTVYGFATAIQHGRAAIDHMADMFVPLYMWRAAAFMSETAPDEPPAVQTRLDALCDTFQRLKPTLVATWSNPGGIP
jgi:glycosyltransferase involved in cell wall biosynthesis